MTLEPFIKYVAKRVLRKGVTLLSPEKPGLYVLTYHRFSQKTTQDGFCVSEAEFEAQVRHLSESGLLVSLEDLITGKNRGVLITIDDGMACTHTIARPILHAYGAPAVAFCIAKHVTESLPGFMTPKQVMECQASGITIGAHSWSHASLARLSTSERMFELQHSKKVLEDICQTRVTTMAYPYGIGKDFSPETDKDAYNAGYEIVFNSIHGQANPVLEMISQSQSIHRVKVEGGDSFDTFKRICNGHMNPWGLLDGLNRF